MGKSKEETLSRIQINSIWNSEQALATLLSIVLHFEQSTAISRTRSNHVSYAEYPVNRTHSRIHSTRTLIYAQDSVAETIVKTGIRVIFQRRTKFYKWSWTTILKRKNYAQFHERWNLLLELLQTMFLRSLQLKLIKN